MFLNGQFKIEPHPHWSPLGVFEFEFSDKDPRRFYMEVSPAFPPSPPGVDAAYAFENGYITANESLHTRLFTFLSNS